MKGLFDFIPLIVFFGLYKTTDRTDPNHPLLALFGLGGGVNNNHILVATLGLIVATVVVYTGLFIQQNKRLDRQQWFILVMTVIFGGITLALKDDYYIRLKAVLINLAFAIGIAISPLITKDKSPIVKKLFEPVLELSPPGWLRLNVAWATLFVIQACLHIFFAFVFAGGEYWGEYTAFGDIIVMMIFVIGMFFVLRKQFKTQ